MQVTLVPPEHVERAWPLALPHMERAAEYTYGRYTVEDILDSVLQYEHHLWLAFNEEATDKPDVRGAVVTCIKQYPRKRYLDMVFVGGEGGYEWKDVMLATLRSWAADNHCDGIESSGRAGWSKIFKSDGYVMLWQTYELPLNNGMEV